MSFLKASSKCLYTFPLLFLVFLITLDKLSLFQLATIQDSILSNPSPNNL
jgi:hypothetical protein